MRELMRTMDESHEDSIRLALDAAGIPVVFRSHGWSTGGAAKYWSTALVDDDAYDRAEAAVAEVRQTSLFDTPESPVLRWLRWGIALAIAGMVAWRLWQMVVSH